MTKDRAKVICRHILVAQQSLDASAPASDPYRLRLGMLHDRLTPEVDKNVVEGEATAFAELQQILGGLEKLRGVQKASSLPAQTRADSNPSTLLPGVADALEHLAKAGALFADLLPPNAGNASR